PKATLFPYTTLFRSVGGDLFRELRQEAHLASDVRDERRGDHLPEDHGIYVGAVQVGALEELARHEPGQIHRPGILEHRPRLAERSEEHTSELQSRGH